MPERAAGYPIMLNLRDRQVAVVGGGAVATRKIERLLRAGARVLLISPAITRELRELAEQGALEWIAARYERDMLNDSMPLLVIAATADARVNQTVAQDAHRIRALCNQADGSQLAGDFSNMAVLERPPLTIALSSNGSSPALLRLISARLASEFGDEYALLAEWLGSLRGELGADPGSQSERQQLYQEIVYSEALSLLREGETEKARRVFDGIALERAPQ